MKELIFGFLGCGGLAALVFFFFNKSPKNPGELIKDLSQSRKIDKIEKINKKQEVIVQQLKVAETASTESKQKVDQIIKTAAKEVNEVLKTDKLAQIDSIINDEWEDL